MTLESENSKTEMAESSHVSTSSDTKASSSDITSPISTGSSKTVVPPSSKTKTSAAPTTTETMSKTTRNAESPIKPMYKPTLKPASPATPPANNDARRLNITTTTLRFNTAADALGDGLMGHEPLDISHDDVALVKTATNSKAWVTKLIQAFGKDYLATPEDGNKNSPSQQEWFTRWQKQAHITVIAIYEAKAADHLEKSCWHLFDAVVKAHELGVVNAANQSTWTASDLKCSERLTFIVSIIEKYALVRLDILRSWHVDEIAANPEAFIKRKITNCWNNGHRAERLSKAVGEAEKSGKSTGKKRAAREEKTTEQGEADGTPVKGKKARQSLPVSEGAENDSKVKGDGKSASKRPHSATTEGAGDKKSVSSSNKQAATLKAPSDDGVGDRGGEEPDDMDEDED